MRTILIAALAATVLASSAQAQDTSPACDEAAGRVIDMILARAPETDHGAEVKARIEEDREDLIQSIAGNSTESDCAAFLLMTGGPVPDDLAEGGADSDRLTTILRNVERLKDAPPTP